MGRSIEVDPCSELFKAKKRERLAKENITEALDLALLARLRYIVAEATKSFNEFEYAGALQLVEGDFWNFCDDYVELVKRRSYEEKDTPGKRSAVATLYLALKTILRLFAPFLPYIPEEVWSWRFAAPEGRERSIHTSPWPTVAELDRPEPKHTELYDCAVELLGKIRQAKTKAQKKLRWPVKSIVIKGSAESLEALEDALQDVLLAGSAEDAQVIKEVAQIEGSEHFEVEIELADNE